MTNHENRQVRTIEEEILFYECLKAQLGDPASPEEIKEINERTKELKSRQRVKFQIPARPPRPSKTTKTEI